MFSDVFSKSCNNLLGVVIDRTFWKGWKFPVVSQTCWFWSLICLIVQRSFHIPSEIGNILKWSFAFGFPKIFFVSNSLKSFTMQSLVVVVVFVGLFCLFVCFYVVAVVLVIFWGACLTPSRGSVLKKYSFNNNSHLFLQNLSFPSVYSRSPRSLKENSSRNKFSCSSLYRCAILARFYRATLHFAFFKFLFAKLHYTFHVYEINLTYITSYM